MSYLSKRGYVIKKDSLSQDELKKLKLELLAKPLIDDKYNTKELDYQVYMETKTKIYIPKMFGINKYGLPNILLDNFNGIKWSIDIEFKGTLLERQIEPVNAILKACEEKGGGILEAQTGTGKTVMLLYILSKLKGKAIIIVNKIPLMNQWRSEIETFLPNAKVGIIQGKNIQIEGCNIILAMLQSMARIDYPDELFNDLQVCVIDEVHNLASKIFSQVLFKLCSKYTIGLSATPQRSDGCEYVFKWHIGNIVYQSNEQRIGKQSIIKLLKIDTKEYKEISNINKYTGEKSIQFTSMLSDLVEMPKRNLLIIELIKNLLHIDSERKILVLSDRRKHVQNLNELLNKDLTVTFSYGLFVGSMKQNDLTQSRASKCILATYAAFSEGVSEKDLDTLILVSPKKFIGHLKNSIKNDSGKLNQIVGRIFRKNHIERHPVIIDFQDNFSIYKSQSASRKVFYKKHFTNGIFEEQSINLDDHENVLVSFIKNKKKTEQIEELNTNMLNKCCIIDD